MGVRLQTRNPSRPAALLCLLALSLLYAPLAAPLWLGASTSCCASGMCPLHGYHHKMPAKAAGMPMDCGHNMSRISSCSLSCCQTQNQAAVTWHPFLLQDVGPPAEAPSVPKLTPSSTPLVLSPSLDPPYPPPRTLSLLFA